MTAILPSLSPCRRHPCSVEHAEMVNTFRSIAEDWLREAERVTRGYPSELAHYRESHPPPSLKAFLIACRRPAESRAA
jgi:hypothetical protein